MAKFRKKPIIVNAVQTKNKIVINTLEGAVIAQPGDWIITGIKGEKYPCRDDIFRETYEPIDADGELALLGKEGNNG